MLPPNNDLHSHTRPIVKIEERRKKLIEPKFSGDFTFRWQGRARQIEWFIVGNRIVIEPKEDFVKISAPARIKLFNKIMAEYRSQSVHPQQIKSVAIGVTSSGHMFIGVNTQRQHEFHKDCSEVNVVNKMTQSLGVSEPDAKFEEFYLMIGFYTPGHKTISEGSEAPMCPCGKCTDMLARLSTENATLVTIPPNDGDMEIPVNYSATSISEVKAGEAWSTKLRVLLIDSTLTLSAEEKEAGREAFSDVTECRKWTRRFTPKIDGVPLDDLRREYKDVINKFSPKLRRAIMENLNGAGSRLGYLRNEFSIEDLNSYMVDKVVEAYKARERLEGGIHNAAKVRCVVVRLNNGMLHSFIEVEGPQENAAPYAEVCAATKASEKAHKITDVWVMEMCPEDIAKGITHTSSKESLERLLKRKPKKEVNDYEGKKIVDTINLHVIPFNNGRLSHDEVEAITRHYDMREIFASRFEGVKFHKDCSHSGGATRH